MKNGFYLAFLCLLVGCATVKNNETIYDGTWILQQKSGGFAGMKTKPENEVKLVIKKDKMKRFENGNLISEEPFAVEKGKAIQSTEPMVLIVSKKLVRQSIKVSGDTLLIADQCYDCFSYLYIKKK